MNQVRLCFGMIYHGNHLGQRIAVRHCLSAWTNLVAKSFLLLLLCSSAWAGIAHTKVFTQQGGSSSGSTFTFTASANAPNEAVVVGVNCASSSAATSVSLTAPGWTFTQLGNIGFSGASSAAVFGAISPNTTSATFTVTWTGAGNCTFHREMGDEFSGTDTTGGTTTFDCVTTCSGGSNNAHSTNGSCSVGVTTGSANEAVWGVCWPNNSVTAIGSGYSPGANDSQGDQAEYKLTGDAAGTLETVNFTSTTTFNALAVTIKPASITGIAHTKVFAQQAGSSSTSTFTFTASANAANEAVVVGVNCVSSTGATSVSLTAPGWAFTQLGDITFTGASSGAAFGAISPNTTSATFTVTWAGAGSCTFHREMGDEFSGTDTTGGTTTFDCVTTCSGGSNNAHSTNGSCSVGVTTGSANEAVWGVCWPSNSVTGVGSGYNPGANDSQGDQAEYKLTEDPAGTLETVNFTSTTTFNALAVTIKPATAGGGGGAPHSIWSPSSAPTVPDGGPDASVELGVKFKSDVDGFINGIRFYKAAANSGIHVANLWSLTGTLLATATSSNETSSGWQEVSFASPVRISADTTYIASYFAPNAHYPFDTNYFASTGVDNLMLHALIDSRGVDGNDGVYAYGNTSNFPNLTYHATNYWVDVVFTSNPNVSTNPSIVSLSSAAGMVGKSVTITGTHFGNTQGTSQVTFNGTQATPLSWRATSIVVPVPPGATTGNVVVTVNGVASNPAAFTVTSTAVCPCTIWSPGSVPTVADGGPDFPVELGVKFRSDVDGFISGIRFYKSSSNTGTHVANLWSDTGTLLATATFVNETGAGWQEVSFPSPVEVTANATYVASYFAPSGHYALDANYFTLAGVDNQVLHALIGSADPGAGNGVYAYGSNSSFPSQSNSVRGANYWVDVVFEQNVSATSPQITSLTPSSGTSGTSVVITGSGFGTAQGNSTVAFNGTTATTVGSWSNTAIQVTVPPQLPLGPASVTVTVPGVGTSNPATFTVVSFAIAATLSPAPNASGWNTSNVTVSFACSGGVAPVQCPPSQLVTSEGIQTISATATDASNATVSVSIPVKLDKTAPALYITSPTNYLTVTNPSITITGTVSDATSGVRTVVCSGHAATIQPGTFYCSVGLVYGPNSIPVTATDVAGNSTSQTLTITFTPPIRDPIANAGPAQTVPVGATVHLDGTGSTDEDGDPLCYYWSFVSIPTGSQAVLAGANTAKPTFIADKPGNYIVQLIVNDGSRDSSPATVVISTQNSQPVANAGANQTVKTGQTVTLDGSVSNDVDGDPLTYAWSFVSVPAGSAATLTNPTAVNPTFVSDQKGSYVVQLVVNDGHVDSLPAQVTINDVNTPPVANAGSPQTVTTRSLVTLDGSASTDVDGDALVFTWSMLNQPAGSVAVLSDTHAVKPTFTVDVVGTYVIQLIVNDGTADSTPVTVTISDVNSPPVANAGLAQSVPLGGVVTLDGTGSSDVDGQTLTYSWSILSTPTGSTATLSLATTANPFFTADVAGNYVIQLIVNDGIVNSQPATVMISTINSIPVADPGANQTGTVGVTVQLDGSASSDADGDPLTYTWSILSQPTGGTAAFQDAHIVNPSFIPNVAGLYIVQLIVNDGKVDSPPKTVTITISSQNLPPVVNAGPNQTITLPVNFVALNGTATDDGQPAGVLNIFWSEVSGPAPVTFSSSFAAITQATFSAAGTYVLRLTANDTQLSSSSQVIVTVLPQAVNQPPVVTAGPSFGITLPVNTATLNGSATDDGLPNGTLTVQWSELQGPASVIFSSPSAPVTQATFFAPGSYLLQLSASDGVFTSTSQTTIVVFPSNNGVNQAPVVDAGPDQIVVLPNQATLNGSAVDDGLPTGSTLTVLWQQISGPGTVTFAPPSSAQTTANFSQPGTYVLQLSATDGQLLSTANVTVHVFNLGPTRTNKGMDFWLAFPGNVPPPAQGPQLITMFIASESNTSGTFSIPGLGISQNFTVAAGQTTAINVPLNAQLESTDAVENKGIHITAQNEVAVYGLSAGFATTDAYLGLPVSMLGTEYIVLGYRSSPSPNGFGFTPSQTDVVAAYDGTTVTITPSTDTPGRKAGVPYSIVLNQGSVYQLRANIASTDLSGSVITSDKPVSVFGGEECVFIHGFFCDYIVEQLPPVSAWGTAFVTMPFSGLPNGDTFRFLASQDNTTVKLSNGEQILLNRGEFSEQIIVGPSSITSDKPILVAQYENAGQFNNNDNSDPNMMLVPPFEQFSGDAIVMAPGAAFSTDAGGFTPNFVNVFADLSSGGSVQIDGTPIPASAFTTIDDTHFSGASVQVSTGSHRLTGNIPFAADSYGYAKEDSYGYGSGVALSSAPDAALSIEPKTTSLATGSQRCTTALVTSLFGEPVGGIAVTFNAFGANTASGQVHTDNFGEATFCYTGAQPGTDTISAHVATLADTAAATWTAGAGNVAPFVDAGPAQTITLPQTAILRGVVAHDQLPAGGGLTVSWQQVSGPAQAVFSNATSAETNSSFTTPGTYVMQLTASDSAFSSSSNVTITVLAHPANQAPVVSAGPNITLDFVKNASGKIHLVGTASDDGIPSKAKLITQWSVVSGPNPVLFSSPTSVETDATFTSSGAADTYVLRLTADDSELQSTSDVTITLIPSNRAPSVSIGNPSPTSLTLPANTVSLTPTVTDDGLPAGVPLTFQWSVTFGSSPVVFSNPTSQNTTATFSAAGTYNLMLSVSDSEFTSTAGVQIVVNPANAPPVVSVPSSATITLPGTLTVTASATDDGIPAGSTLAFQWAQTSGPAPVTFSAPTSLTTTVTFTQAGNYQLAITANDSQLTTTRIINVTVNPQNQPPVVFPGPDQTLSLPTTTITIAGTVTDDGLPAGVPLSIQWSEVSGPAAVTFTAPTSATTNAVFSTAGNYVLQLSASDSQFTASRTMNVTVFAAPQNQPPTVSAGPNQTVTIPSLTSPAQAFLNASLHDDGLPAGKPLTVSWSQVSGPAAATFVSPTSQQTFVRFTVAGVYVLRITASDTQLTSTSDVQITVNPPINQPPVFSNFVSPVITLPTNTTSFSTATVTDDGLPVGAPVTVLLTQTDGPAPIQFADPTNLHTQMTFSAPGRYDVRITATDTQLTSTTTLAVIVNQGNTAPVINGPAGYTVVQPANTLTFTNTVTDDGQPAGAPLTALWTQVSGPQLVQFADPTNPQTTATFPAVGGYVLKLTASDTQLTTIAQIGVTVQAAPDPAPFVKIISPGDGSVITQPVPVVATSSAERWTVDYVMNNPDGTVPPNNPDGSVPKTFTHLASFDQVLDSANVGTFDPTVLQNGIYTIRLTARSSSNAGALISTDSVTVTVQGRAKPGAFRLAFRDLTIPLPGMSLDIIRSYDSTDSGIHDFGLGWSLGVNSARLQRNRNIGFGWTETATQTAFPTFCLLSNNDRFVTISFPDDRVYKFRAVASPECDIINPITVPALAFVQVPTGAGTAGATLVTADGASLLVDGAVPGPVNLVDISGQPYNPTIFRLTTMEGFSYVIDQNRGVTSITDPNNNTINIGPNGITSSSGVSVPFIRNASGQITQITDPQGNQLKYTYDQFPRLTSFTDGAHNLTTFGYPDALLSSIIDARGVNILQSFFSGNRLSTVTDASGKITNFSYNAPGQTETVLDRLGNSTTYTYDDDGNVTSTTDALGKTTFATYDASDNKLTETNALGKTTSYTYDESGNRLTETDPLGNVTRYAYNGRHQVLSVTDALGHSTSNSYDANGNLLTSTDPLGKQTIYTYNSQGLPLTVKDPLNGLTTFAYDTAGHVSSQTDALNNVTSFTYDANGNKLTQVVKRTKSDGTLETLTTSYQYDGDNRVTKTTNPDQTFTRVVYNAIGKQSDTFDALNHQTHYDYDANGRLTKVTYPDTTFESYTYDLDDRKLTSTDRAGHTTSYTYDAVGRLTKTTFFDTSFTQTVYDAAGRTIQTIDARNNSTSYGYDDAGRRTSVTDAAQKTTTFTYDAAGNQTSMLDALQHLTQFSYDAANRRVQTQYPDQSSDSVGYDALGRQTSKTDQAGKITQFGYDALGRLTSVTQFLNNVPLITGYAYDEIGNRISQTDANNHITRFAYDQLGRRVSRTLPLGQSESYAYDAAGNLASRIDFNNHTTTYSYDNMNRLTLKTADVFFSAGACAAGACGATQVGYTYTATGRRASMTDASGLTSYIYDTRDRLLTKGTPFGTLTYTYDAQGNILTLKSSNVGGASMTYTYDPLNRLASVTDPSGATSYTYDAVGNLTGFAYPNGVLTSYGYNALNRLTTMQSTCATGTGCGAPGTALATYAYTLGPAGNRLSVAELSGRTVNYGYDDLYRLTSETIAGATSQNGAVSYQYDSVGNRLQRSSTVPALPATGLLNYDANDRTASDPYDADGNLLNGGVGSNIYDFENHLVAAGGVSLAYDGDGNRVQETVAGVTTSYLVADQNLTGYAQVMDELLSGAVSRTYSYGLELINERQSISGTPTTSFYGFDGHGSVRFLLSSTGAVTDTYDYDAFGNLIASTGSTPNNFRFAGEQFDRVLGIYYNRARYYDQRQGRFWTMDTYEGDPSSPASLHKYLYGAEDPVDKLDQSGNDFDLAEQVAALTISTTIANIAITALASHAIAARGPIPDGVILSGRINLNGYSFTGGGGVDLYYDLHTSQLWYALTGEAGLSPLSRFNNFRGLGYAFTVGAAWGTSAQTFSGFGFGAIWPRRAFLTILGVLAGQNEAFGTLTRLARLTNNVRFTDWAAVVGYSTSGGGYFQIGPRSNSFSSVVSYSSGYRLVTNDVVSGLGFLGQLIDKARSLLTGGISDSKYLELLDALNP